MNILYVEDNDDHAELALRSMTEQPWGEAVHRVCDGEQALDYLMRRGQYADTATSPRPELILLDLRLPRIDGLEVLRRIKSDDALRRIPVVVLTTSDADKDIARAYDLHANSYLVKPIELDRFQALMNDLGLFWMAWNERPRQPEGWVG